MSERMKLRGESECPFCYGTGMVVLVSVGDMDECEMCGGEGTLPVIEPIPEPQEANR